MHRLSARLSINSSSSSTDPLAAAPHWQACGPSPRHSPLQPATSRKQGRPVVQTPSAVRISVDGQPSPASYPQPPSGYERSAGYDADWVKCADSPRFDHCISATTKTLPTVCRVPSPCRQLQVDAPYDEEVAQLLEGANGDPEIIRQRVQRKEFVTVISDALSHRCSYRHNAH